MSRVINTIQQYSNELKQVFNQYDITEYIINHPTINIASDNVGIIHLTDLHFNEVIVDILDNNYDFKVASKRLHKFISKAKQYFINKNINTILLAMTGDLINSDRRLQQLLSQATNRSKATFLAVNILSNILLDLTNEYDNIFVANVSGNQSRMTKDIGWTQMLASDNYDFTIFNILKYIYRQSDIKFIAGDSYQNVITIGADNNHDINILLLHGNNAKLSGNVQYGVQQIMGKYSSKGINIHFMLFGHYHSCRIGDNFARGGSLSGANGYSDKYLQMSTKASQNIHIINRINGQIDSIKIDLQNTDGYDGYLLEQKLYNQLINTSCWNKEHITII